VKNAARNHYQDVEDIMQRILGMLGTKVPKTPNNKFKLIRLTLTA
jgi:hypothetical protein